MSTQPVTAPAPSADNGKAVNGEAAAGVPQPPRQRRQERFAQSFSNIVAVLMRDPTYRNLRLADLEWLVLPPVMAGQWRLGQAAPRNAKPAAGSGGTLIVPVAVALWARVSPAVDERLSSNLGKPMALKPTEWASGDITWLMVAAGDPQALPGFLKKLAETEFKDIDVKLRARGPDGTALVKMLEKA